MGCCRSCGSQLVEVDGWWAAYVHDLCVGCHQAVVETRRLRWVQSERVRLMSMERRRQIAFLRDGERTLRAIRRLLRGVSGSRGGGVRSGEDFANLMSALMGDVIEGTISPNVANAACNAGRQLLRITEMQYRWGTANAGDGPLMLAPGKP